MKTTNTEDPQTISQHWQEVLEFGLQVEHAPPLRVGGNDKGILFDVLP